MAEWRTQEQVDADQALHQAIQTMLAAYTDDPEKHKQFIMTEYIVISARVGISDEAEGHTTYDYSLSNGSLPWHNMMGLMVWAHGEMTGKMNGTDGQD